MDEMRRRYTKEGEADVPEHTIWRRMVIPEQMAVIADMSLAELKRFRRYHANGDVITAIQAEIHSRENRAQVRWQFLVATGIAIIALLVAIAAWLRPL